MINKISSIFMRFPAGRPKALTFSYDDGVMLDRRLIEILDRHGMKGTFNINSGIFAPEDKVFPDNYVWQRMTEQQIYDTYANSQHEVAVHAYSHPFLETLPPAAIAHEIIHDREKLETMFGKIIRGMAYPMGTYNDTVVDVLRACGIVYARTTVSTEKFDIPTDWLRLPATCHHKNPRLMELAQNFVEMNVTRHSKLFYLWGHSYEFGEQNNWNVIEEFTEYMSNREDEIWYATNIETYEYIEDFNRLVFSTDCSIVHNPTNRRLWFALKNNTVDIAPGETKKLC